MAGSPLCSLDIMLNKFSTEAQKEIEKSWNDNHFQTNIINDGLKFILKGMPIV